MKKLCVVTATRAEYGLLAPIIEKLRQEPDVEVHLVVTGAHLSPEFGSTVREIEAAGTPIDRRIDILLSADSPAGASKTMALALMGFADYFEDARPDALLLLGDRFELLAVGAAAMNERIPIVHLYGGETTEGAVDEAVRHSLTKMAALHFTGSEASRKRVIQMGEAPERVFAVGAMGPENALNMPKLTRRQLEESLQCSLGARYAVLTYHPVTLESSPAEKQVDALARAVERFPEITFLCTKANADAGGRAINERLLALSQESGHVLLFDSLGAQRYLSAVSGAEFVIGNSSSGLSEVPSLGVPTINIGDRQKGREHGPSVIDCPAEEEAIAAAIRYALTPEAKEIASRRENPYGDGNASARIAEITADFLRNGCLSVQKTFYDIVF